MDVLAALREEFGTLSAQAFSSRSIAETKDLIRVRALRRRVWQDDPELADSIRLLTAHLRYDHTECTPLCYGCMAKELRPAQAAFLRELYDLGEGAMLPLRVGAGKTLLGFLAPALVKAQRPLLVVPAAQVERTMKARREYARHWKIANVTVVSYEFLSHPKQLHWLDNLAPDFVFCDESHKLKSSSSRCTKRLSKYLKANPTVRACFASGSAAGRSIKDYWHYTRWALGSRAPVPSDPIEMAAWAYALDEKVPPEARFEPGALLTLGTAEGDDDLERARRRYRDRFNASPGIVSSGEDIPPVGLELTGETVALPPVLEQAIVEMRKTWCTPGGEEFMLALELWRHARTLGCGLYYRWDPPAPKEWLARRKDWCTFVRDTLKYSRKMDSVVHLVQQIKADPRHSGAGIYARWLEVEPTFKPNSVPVWVDRSMLERCAAWLEEAGDGANRGVCWVEHAAFGRELARMTGLPFFHARGLNADGIVAEAWRGGSAIMSIKACREGQNLQHFARALYPSPPSTGGWWEQLLGRHHRDGQLADTVTGHVYLTCKESFQSLAQAIRDAICIQDRDGIPQKLCYANKDLGPVMDLALDQSNENWHNEGV